MNELSELFKLVAQEKKQKREEYESLVGDLGLDSIFEEVSVLKTKSKIKNKKGHKALKVFEDLLSSREMEPNIEEEIEEIFEVVEELQEELEEPKYPTLMERSLGLLSEPSNVKQQNDPLTPLDQKFATLEDLEKHYKLFLSRIQQQLSTIGGGGISGINVTQDDTGVRYPLLAAGTNSDTTAQYIDNNGLVYNTNTNCLGIGSLTPTSRLDIIGDVKVVGIVTASDFNSSSDIKLKTNIKTITNPIEKVLQISGVNFNWKESGKATMGVIAQEVEKVLPELVSDTDPKSVNYNGLIGLLIECIKDQQRQIDTPSIPIQSPGALNIVGSSNGAFQVVSGAGNMLHITSTTTQASTLTVDFTGPDVIFWQPSANGNRTVTLTNFTANRGIRIFITPHAAANTFTFTGVTASQCSNGSNVYQLGGGGAAQASMMIELFSTSTAVGGVWIFAHGGV